MVPVKQTLRGKLKRALSIAKIAIFILIVFGILRPEYSLPLVARPLQSNSQPDYGADYVVVLMGSPTTRPIAGANAVLNGYAPKLLMADSESNSLEEAGLIPRESELARKMAESTGLSPDQIVIVKDAKRVSSTTEEAIAIKDYLIAQSPKPSRIIVVTSWYHTRRAQWIFSKVLAGFDISIEAISVSEPKFATNNWWKSESGLITVFEEYIKWIRYLIKYSGRDLTNIIEGSAP